MRLKVRAAAVCLFAFFLTTVSLAQITNVTGEQSPPIPGAGHDYIHLLSETVNPSTGAVSLRINVPVPPSRGITVPFSFGYDSNAGHHYSYVPDTWTDNSSYMGRGGWSYVVPLMNASANDWTQTLNTSPPIPSNCRYYNSYLFVDAHGGTHSLPLSVVQQIGGACDLDPAYANNYSPNQGYPPLVNYLSGGVSGRNHRVLPGL